MSPCRLSEEGVLEEVGVVKERGEDVEEDKVSFTPKDTTKRISKN